MKKVIGLAAVCALVVGAYFAFTDATPTDVPGDAKPAARALDASLLPSAKAATASSSRPPAPAQTADAGQGKSFDRELRSLWSMPGTQLLQIFQRGLASPTLEDKYLAYLAYDLCHSTFRSSVQHAQIPGVTGDVARHMDDARRTLRDTCAPFLGIRLEQLTRDGAGLRDAIAAPGSPFSQSLPDRGDAAAQKTFRQMLREQFDRYGPAALEWNAANLAEWLLQKDRPPGQGDKSLETPESRRIETAAYLSMCYPGFDCSRTSGGLLVLCTQSAVCGNDLREALLSKLDSPGAREKADQLARQIGEAIASRRYDLLAL